MELRANTVRTYFSFCQLLLKLWNAILRDDLQNRGGFDRKREKCSSLKGDYENSVTVEID